MNTVLLADATATTERPTLHNDERNKVKEVLKKYIGFAADRVFQVRNTFIHVKEEAGTEVVEDQRALQFSEFWNGDSGSGRQNQETAFPADATATDERNKVKEVLKKYIGFAADRVFQVRNTFIHVKELRTATTERPTLHNDERKKETLAPGAKVEIEGLTKFPGFNGLHGTVVSLDRDMGRHKVQLSSADRMTVPPPPPFAFDSAEWLADWLARTSAANWMAIGRDGLDGNAWQENLEDPDHSVEALASQVSIAMPQYLRRRFSQWQHDQHDFAQGNALQQQHHEAIYDLLHPMVEDGLYHAVVECMILLDIVKNGTGTAGAEKGAPRWKGNTTWAEAPDWEDGGHGKSDWGAWSGEPSVNKAVFRKQFKKPQMCRFFQRSACRKGEYCEFAHGPQELAQLLPANPRSQGSKGSFLPLEPGPEMASSSIVAQVGAVFEKEDWSQGQRGKTSKKRGGKAKATSGKSRQESSQAGKSNLK
eukprot:symbB.v1.2.019838.t2/scaffold1644.1/size164340/8